MRGFGHVIGVTVLAVFAQWASANDEFFDSLPQVEIAPDVIMIEGRQESFNSRNYGAIANSVLIDSDRGVLVIDTGSNRLFGEWLKRLAVQHFNRPIVGVINTHGHPDHWFGNSAFEGVPKLATRDMIEYSRGAGSDLLDTLYSAVGDAMVGTELSLPDLTLGTSLSWGRYEFEVIVTSSHSDGDAALFDSKHGLLIAGDLVFNGRAPTTPHANLRSWIQILAALEARSPKVVVPGHGPVDRTIGSIIETRDYLQWLEGYLRDAAKDATDPALLIASGVPDEWKHLAVIESEFGKSVVHLYPDYEAEFARQVTGR